MTLWNRIFANIGSLLRVTDRPQADALDNLDTALDGDRASRRKRQRITTGDEMDKDYDFLQTPPEKKLRGRFDDLLTRNKTKTGSWGFNYTKLWNFVVGGRNAKRPAIIRGESSMEDTAQSSLFDMVYDPQKYGGTSKNEVIVIDDDDDDEQPRKAVEITQVPDVEITRSIPESCRRLGRTSRGKVKRIKNLDDEDENELSISYERALNPGDLHRTFGKFTSASEMEMSTLNASLPGLSGTRFSGLNTTKSREDRRTVVENVVRLNERDRYCQLVSQFTSLRVHRRDPHESPLRPKSGEVGKRGRMANMDLIIQKFSASLPDVSARNLQDEIAIREQSKLETASFNTGTVSARERSLKPPGQREFSGADRSNQMRGDKKTKDVDDLFNDKWIRKWKDVLSPQELTREKLIRREERKLQELRDKREKEEKAKETKKDEFPALTQQMNDQIDAALRHGNPSEKLSEGFNAVITRGDIHTLVEKNWLNDEVINFYLSLLKERSSQEELPSIHVFNTFFYPKLLRTGHSGVKRWTKKVDLFTLDLVIIPIHLGMHWCLAVIDFRKKTIIYYDSLKGDNRQCMEAVKFYLEMESKEKRREPFNSKDWSLLMPKDIPEQLNGCDCGVFACKYAEYLTRDAPLNFTQANMPYFRRRMIYEILNKQLL